MKDSYKHHQANCNEKCVHSDTSDWTQMILRPSETLKKRLGYPCKIVFQFLNL